MYIAGIIILTLSSVLMMDFHARRVFIARGYCRRYGHGKSWNRAHKHYKTNWSILERMIWMPVFKEWYENKYRNIAYLSYAHFALAFVVIIAFLIDEFVILKLAFWHYIFVAFAVFTILRVIYDDAIATGKI